MILTTPSWSSVLYVILCNIIIASNRAECLRYYLVKSKGISTDGRMVTLSSSDKDVQQASYIVTELVDSKIESVVIVAESFEA